VYARRSTRRRPERDDAEVTSPKAGAKQPLVFARIDEASMRERGNAFLETMRTRRSVRDFSDEPIPLDVVMACIEAAAQAPSGANKQPWTFVLVTDPETKSRIRAAAEKEEQAFYAGAAARKWLDALEPLGTGPEKPFLERAPALIAVFAQRHGNDVGDRHYYVVESVGIAVGFLLAALHHAGLATLTHTPAPMQFLSDVLGRPPNERAFCLIPVGYPANGCEVPVITRKPLDGVLVRK
jgi:nitroreductase